MKKCLISKYGDVVWCPNWLKNLEWYLMSSWIFHWRFWKSKIWISVNSGLDGFDTCFLDIYLMGRLKKILCNFQSVNCEKNSLFPVHLVLKSYALFSMNGMTTEQLLKCRLWNKKRSLISSPFIFSWRELHSWCWHLNPVWNVSENLFWLSRRDFKMGWK